LLFEPAAPAPIALYARDILKDPFYRWLQASLAWIWILLVHIVLVFCVGVGLGIAQGKPWADSLQLGLSVMVWGVFVRTIVVWHVTWSVNSFSHMFGYRNYDVRDASRNNIIVALLGSGEGWHNNHHADAASASNWHRWWEIDFTWLLIRALRAVGLAYDVIPPRAKRLARTGSPGSLHLTSEPTAQTTTEAQLRD
jgi:stearoyl-CoA desaturase (delta-9 desaturase)